MINYINKDHQVYTDWFKYLSKCYTGILNDSLYFDTRKPLMIDIDGTVLYDTYNEIPGSVTFVNTLSKRFLIYFVTARKNTIHRRNDTVKDLRNFRYDRLYMRPSNMSTKKFKFAVKCNIQPAASIGDNLTDYPEYLLYNPFNKY